MKAIGKNCIIVGGGIAGPQAAIQLNSYKHNVLVIDSNHGRSTLCKCYHNTLGWPNGISGQELRQIGKRQAEKLGVDLQGFILKMGRKLRVNADLLHSGGMK